MIVVDMSGPRTLKPKNLKNLKKTKKTFKTFSKKPMFFPAVIKVQTYSGVAVAQFFDVVAELRALILESL